MLKKDTGNFIWNYLWLILFAIGFGIFLIVTPKYYDDYWYMWDLSGWFEKQGIWYPTEGGNVFRYGIPWNDISETVLEHLRKDTARLCNVTVPFLLLFPKWLVSGISLLTLLYSVCRAFRIADVDIRKSWLVSVGIGIWTLTFLWYDVMGDVVYQVNYLWSTALCLWWLPMLNKRDIYGPSFIFFIFLTLLIGLWHEGFTAPLFVSSGIMLIFYKKFRNAITLSAFLIFGICMIWHFAGASFTGSATFGRAAFGYYEINFNRLMRMIFYHRAMWMMGIVSIIFIIKKGLKSYYRNPFIVFMLAGTIVALGQAYVTDIARAAWWGDVTSLILTLFLLKKLEMHNMGYKGWRLILSVLVLGASYVQLIALDILTIKFAKEFPRIISNYIKEPSKTQFSELLDYPWVSLPFSQITHVDRYRWSQYPQKYYGIDSTLQNRLKVVPERLRYVREEDLEPLEGNMEAMKFGPFVVARSKAKETYLVGNLDIDYEKFKVKYRVMECVPFVSEADSLNYIFLDPLYSRTEYRIGDIKGIWKRN